MRHLPTVPSSARMLDIVDVRFPVVERFVSINGEGLSSGKLAAFVRFAGCNLDCSYCDTRWANAPDVAVEMLSVEEVVEWVCSTSVSAVTLTGGEPLLQPGLDPLVGRLLRVRDPHPLQVEVETNGSLPVAQLVGIRGLLADEGFSDRLHLTLDWKTPATGMSASDEELIDASMMENARLLNGNDAVKFVVGSSEDVSFARRKADEAGLWDRCTVLLSPLWGQMDPARIVDAMRAEGLTEARLQLQLHKILWPQAVKGV